MHVSMEASALSRMTVSHATVRALAILAIIVTLVSMLPFQDIPKYSAYIMEMCIFKKEHLLIFIA